MPGPQRQPIEIRFSGYVLKGGEDECWRWAGPTNGGGYPTIGRGGKGGGQVSARLLAYRLAFDEVPVGEVTTSCGSTACLNPRHLTLRQKKPRLTMSERFWAKVRRGEKSDCWPWTAHETNGYGYLAMGRKKGPIPAHRVSWELANGPIPEGLLIRQKCGNRLCCNPAHLFLALNAMDSVEASARAVGHWLA